MKDLNVIIDFSDVPPQYRAAAFGIFQQHRMAIKPLGEQESLKYVFSPEILSNSMMISYFNFLIPNLTNIGVKLIYPEKEKQKIDFPKFQLPKDGAIDFDFSDVPPQNRSDIVQAFRNKNIHLIPLEKEDHFGALFYRAEKEAAALFYQDQSLQDMVNKNNIQYVLAPKYVPALKTTLPKAFVNQKEQARQKILETKTCYLYQKTMEKIKPTPLRKLKNIACAGVSTLVLSALINPNGTTNFNNALIQGRPDKIINQINNELIQTGKNIINGIQHPKETWKYIDNHVAHQTKKNAQYLQNRSLLQTGEDVLTKGMLNIGSTTFNAAAAVVNDLWNIYELFPQSDEYFIQIGDLSYKAFAKNPDQYLTDAFVRIDKKTTLKSNDTIFSIIDDGRIKAAKAYISQGLLYQNTTNQKYLGITPLRYAIEKNQPQIAQLILEASTDYLYQNTPDGKSDLMRAIEVNALFENELSDGEIHTDERSSDNVQKYKEMQHLIFNMAKNRFVNINAVCPNGKSVLESAVESGNCEIVSYLMNQGVTVTYRNISSGDYNLMHLAGNNPKMIHLLHEHAIPLHELNSKGNTPFVEILTYSDTYPGKNDKAIAAFLSCLTPEWRKELHMAPFYGYYIDKWAERNKKQALTLLELPQEKELSLINEAMKFICNEKKLNGIQNIFNAKNNFSKVQSFLITKIRELQK